MDTCTRKEATCLVSVTTRFFFCRTWLGNMPLALALTVTIHTKSGSLLWASTGVCLYSQSDSIGCAWQSNAALCVLSCRDGITFALEQLEDTVEGDTPTPPPNLDFLQVLSEFIYRLLEVDRTGKKGVAAYLEDQLPAGLLERVEGMAEWEPLRAFIRNLTGREQAADTTNQSEQEA